MDVQSDFEPSTTAPAVVTDISRLLADRKQAISEQRAIAEKLAKQQVGRIIEAVRQESFARYEELGLTPEQVWADLAEKVQPPPASGTPSTPAATGSSHAQTTKMHQLTAAEQAAVAPSTSVPTPPGVPTQRKKKWGTSPPKWKWTDEAGETHYTTGQGRSRWIADNAEKLVNGDGSVDYASLMDRYDPEKDHADWQEWVGRETKRKADRAKAKSRGSYVKLDDRELWTGEDPSKWRANVRYRFEEGYTFTGYEWYVDQHGERYIPPELREEYEQAQLAHAGTSYGQNRK